MIDSSTVRPIPPVLPPVVEPGSTDTQATREFLVRDMPGHVVFGSHAWASLHIAVARQEAHAPGSAPNMTYAQIMHSADTLTEPAPYHAQREALIDWGVCNGYLRKKADDAYTDNELEPVRTAFNEQLTELQSASTQLTLPLPSRRKMALDALKQHFPNIEPALFEAGVLSIKDCEFNPGSRSMLDILMEGIPSADTWETRDKRIPMDAFNTFCKNPENAITPGFESALTAQKNMHGTLVKQLITRLPLEDRECFAYGKIEFFKDATYAPGIFSDTLQSRKNSLLVKIEYNKRQYVYEIDPEHGLIQKKPLLVGKLPGSRRVYNDIYKVERFTPQDKSQATLRDKRVGHSYLSPQSFASDRTRHIADAYVEALGIDAQARGLTSFDKERGQQEALKQFLLDLIPLRSAINHFSDGNYAAGAVDLAIDIFGFVTAGLGAGAKVAKVVGSTATTAHKALKSVKILGVAAIGELNPANGIVDAWAQSRTLMPHTLSRQHSGSHRYNPVAISSRPPFAPAAPQIVPRKTDHLLPGDYLVNTRAKEVHAHFTPSRLDATRERFRNDMATFYRQPLPTAPRPTLAAPTTPNTLIENTLDHTNTLVFGESHRGMASFQTLYDAMDTFKAKGVKSFFCEGLLPDGKGGWKDAGLGTIGSNARTPGKFPTLEQLLKKAEDNGIQVIPLEHYWLTKRKDTPGLYHNLQPDTPLSKQRLEEFNYFAARTIEQHANGGKSVVLVGRSHLMTCEGVPGLTELTQGVGISLYEGAQNLASKSTRHLPDPAKSLKNGDMAGDFQVYRKVT